MKVASKIPDRRKWIIRNDDDDDVDVTETVLVITMEMKKKMSLEYKQNKRQNPVTKKK